MPEAAKRVILASGSPRRRELLTNLGVSFDVVVSGEDEATPETNPERLAHDLGLLKASSVARLHQDAVVIAADTVVALGTELLAKPANVAENAEFIRKLAGQVHQVFTGVSVICPAGTFSGVERTDVEFRPLNEAEIQFYARTGEGLDKAGGYGIQGVGMGLVARVNGDYSNIVGFPLALVIRLLRQAGVPVWNDLTGAALAGADPVGAFL